MMTREETNMKQKRKYALDDIVGYEPEKQKLAQIADIFSRYEEYSAKGIDVPKGLLLSGGPGVGKTLFTKVFASLVDGNCYEFSSRYSNAHLLSLSLKRVFKRASRHAPSIVFIDEIDTYFDQESDASSGALATLLTLLDGASSYPGVMLIGTTTEDVDRLPPALLRSGRMDEKIRFRLPNQKEREEMIRFYLKKINLGCSIDPKAFAYHLGGRSGADIANFVSLSARNASYAKRDNIIEEDCRKALVQIDNDDIDRESTQEDQTDIHANHQAAHALVARALIGYCETVVRDVEENDIGDKLNDLEGFVEEGDEDLSYVGLIKAYISSMLAPVELERKEYGSPLFLSYVDIENAYKTARSLVRSGILGYEYYYIEDRESLLFSDAASERVENKVIEVLNECSNEARDVLERFPELLNKLRETFVKQEITHKSELDEIFAPYLDTPKA